MRLLILAFAIPALTALMVLLGGCSTAKMAYRDIKASVKTVNDHFGCHGVELNDDAAFCVGDVSLTVTIRGNWDPAF